MTNVIKPKLVIKAKVTRADGTKENLGVLTKRKLPGFISRLIQPKHG